MLLVQQAGKVESVPLACDGSRLGLVGGKRCGGLGHILTSLGFAQNLFGQQGMVSADCLHKFNNWEH